MVLAEGGQARAYPVVQVPEEAREKVPGRGRGIVFCIDYGMESRAGYKARLQNIVVATFLLLFPVDDHHINWIFEDQLA